MGSVGFGAGIAASNTDATVTAGLSVMDAFRRADLSALLIRPAAAASAVAIQDPAVTAALQAMETALQALTKSQQSGGISRAILWIGVPLAGALAIHHFGWARIGWVTGEQLTVGLQKVRDYVGEQIVSLSETLSERFGRVEARLAETAETVLEVRAATAEVKAEVHAVAETLATLEQRMTPLESNAATAAHGVEVLCELVKTSGLLSNASPTSLQRLDSFTSGVPSHPQPSPRELELPTTRPELMAPPELPSPPTVPAPQLRAAAPSFMRALVDAQAVP